MSDPGVRRVPNVDEVIELLNVSKEGFSDGEVDFFRIVEMVTLL